MTTRSRSRPPRETLQVFGGRLALAGWFAKRWKIFGIDTPVAIIAIIVMITLVALTVWGIIFSRAPQLITQHIEHRYDVASPQFIRSMGVLLGPALEPGNRVDTLVNGDQIFPAMLEAIRGAKRSITFES